MASDPTRRRFLVASGALGAAALAGCTGTDSDGDDATTGMHDSMTETAMDDSMTETAMDDAMTGSEMDDGMTETGMDGGMGAMDPADAPRASIDRFSEAAGTLMVRSAENGLPGPDEPIDFDRAPFLTRGLGPDGGHVSYYNFDVRPTAPAPIYAFFREGEDTPVEGQLNVIDVVPGDEGYNDFWQVHKVTVPADYEANTVTSASQLMAGDYAVTATNVLKNCPVVPAGSTASMRYGDGEAGLVNGWYDGQVVSYFLFEEAPLTVTDGRVPVSPIYVTFNTNPGEAGGGPASGFAAEAMGGRTHNVVATLPGDDGYSPLWLVNVYDNADFEAVSDLESARAAGRLASGTATVNCPVVAGGMAG
ncbi:MAG: hypothetical protein ABEJ92_10750 [Halobacteriales archaeon]